MIKIERTDKVYDTISEVFKKDTKLYMLYHYESPTNHTEATEYNAMHNTVCLLYTSDAADDCCRV